MHTRARHEALPHRTSDLNFQRPQLRAGVRIVDQRRTSPGTWLVLSHDVPVARISSGTAMILGQLDGSSTLEQLTASNAGAFTLGEIETLIEKLQRTGLIVGSVDPVVARSRVVSYIPPMTLQIATRNAAAFFAYAARVTKALHSRSFLVGVALIVVAAFGSAIFEWRSYVSIGSVPLKPITLVAVLVALSIATFFHELAHGLTLQKLGGVPRRAGFMLFYLAPAFFVDVTDGWRLPRRWHRAAVAFAGPAFHLVAASAAAVIAVILPGGAARDALHMFSFAAFWIFAFNLVPFVRFDGYLILIALLDYPNLRAAAIAELKRVLFAERRQRDTASPAWGLAAFGLGSIAFPVYLVLVSISRLQSGLAGAGAAGAFVLLGVETFLAYLIVRVVIRLVQFKQYSIWRLFGGTFVAVAALGSALVMIQVPIEHRAAWVSDERGIAMLAQSDSDLISLTQGEKVSLISQGIFSQSEVGTARVSGETPEKADIPVESLVPISLHGFTTSGYRVVLSDASTVSTGKSGTAIIWSGESEALMQVLLNQYVRSPVEEIANLF
ncbi:daptide biosynthesis intramembrane metalloprotease [Rathayibacter iranicus]